LANDVLDLVHAESSKESELHRQEADASRESHPLPQHGADTSSQDTWSSLSHAIKEIQNERAMKLSFEENYRHAYNLVLFRQGEFLYKNVKTLIEEHLTALTDELIISTFAAGNHDDPITRGQEGELLMKGVRKVWDKHNSSMRRLSDILKYMVSVSLFR
jgi:cullin 3